MREVSRCNVLLLLDCAHTQLLKGVRSDSFPDFVWCRECDKSAQVVESVDNRPEVRADNGRSF